MAMNEEKAVIEGGDTSILTQTERAAIISSTIKDMENDRLHNGPIRPEGTSFFSFVLSGEDRVAEKYESFFSNAFHRSDE